MKALGGQGYMEYTTDIPQLLCDSTFNLIWEGKRAGIEHYADTEKCQGAAVLFKGNQQHDCLRFDRDFIVKYAIWSNLVSDVETCRLWQQKAHIYARPIGSIDENLSDFVYGKL